MTLRARTSRGLTTFQRPRRCRHTPATVHMVQRLYFAGVSRREILRRTGVPPGSIWYLAHRHACVHPSPGLAQSLVETVLCGDVASPERRSHGH